MAGMFEGASAFNRDIGGWAVHSVTVMWAMFSDASSFDQDISGWAVHSVADMNHMFKDASAFDQDLGWCVDDDVNLDEAFSGTKCASTSCGVAQKDANGVCIITTLAPTQYFDGVHHTDVSIRAAVNEWVSDASAAETTYGHISTWETSGVTDM